jgi:hypothetical protein
VIQHYIDERPDVRDPVICPFGDSGRARFVSDAGKLILLPTGAQSIAANFGKF